MQAKRGFTLVEILIVVVILGILAAIVIPQFTQASTEAKTNSLASDLQSLRSQIQLYKVQHNDVAPAFQNDTFENQMLYVTDVDGNVKAGPSKIRDTGAGAVYVYGPYLERIPENPFSGLTGVGDGNDPNVGWAYTAATGEIHAGADSTPQSAEHQAM
jgi:general secretion pathway protein G